MIGVLRGTGTRREHGGRENVSALSRHLFGVLHSLRADDGGRAAMVATLAINVRFVMERAAHPGYVHFVRAQALLARWGSLA